MNGSARWLLVLAALSGFLSVVAGAAGQHAGLDPAAQNWLHVGSRYEAIHALAVFAAVFVARAGARAAIGSAILFLVGTLLFSGALYALALGAPPAFAAPVPIGGLCFMAGWLVLAWAAFAAPRST